jgi:serine/threonine protein kinase
MESSHSTELDALIADYLQAIERGEQPDPSQWIAQHPEYASELAKFQADLDLMKTTRWKLDRAAIEGATGDLQAGALIAARYKLIENIGEGGMGAVWMAEQQPIKRRVALKLVKAGMDSKQVLARFEAERQALALMDHPNIAKVFDGGRTDQGRPFFVMEYVKGVPLTAYCDSARLSLTERLQLFIPVCQAVQHAQQKGIVHRDLKPSNILVCLYDGRPVPKVIDFGLAKALHRQLTEATLFTGHGVMFLARKFQYMRFEPSGSTHHVDLGDAASVVDYVFRWLGITFSSEYRDEHAVRRLNMPTPSNADREQEPVSRNF